MVRILISLMFVVGLALIVWVVSGGDSGEISSEKINSSEVFQVLLSREETPFELPSFPEGLPAFDGAIGGVVPHHLMASDFLAEFFAQLSKRSSVPKTIVILAPNHFEVGEENIQTADFLWQTAAGVVETDLSILERAKRGGAIIRKQTFQQEHGIYNILPYVAHFLPGTKVVPILFRHGTTAPEIDRLVESIQESVQSDGAFIISSVDFSHYLSKPESERMDTETIEAMRKYDMSRIASFGSDHLDSPPAIMTLLRIGQKNNVTDVKILRHGNSADTIRSRSDSTTSHFTLIISK